MNKFQRNENQVIDYVYKVCATAAHCTINEKEKEANKRVEEGKRAGNCVCFHLATTNLQGDFHRLLHCRIANCELSCLHYANQ